MKNKNIIISSSPFKLFFLLTVKASNSDDPVFSGSNLSMEYVEVAKLYYLSNKSQGESEESGDRIGYLSKWEVLRLVKNSFKFAFLEKQKLRKLMKGAEEEVYSVILETEGYR